MIATKSFIHPPQSGVRPKARYNLPGVMIARSSDARIQSIAA
ncbi:MAG: hypothetical protein ACU0BB_15145 [Paracoccaceae bacterium]